MVYKLTIEARTKSKAKLWGRSIKQYVFGKNFEVYYILKNVGAGQRSPKCRFKVVIKWQGTELSEFQEYDVPQIEPGKDHYTGAREWGVLSHLGSFHISSIEGDRPQLKFYTTDDHEITPITVFHAVFGMPPEGVYEYWGLKIAVIGLSIIAVEKIFGLLRWIF